MFVIGTAGHIDHGKSTLIQALTGIDPDRLKEEKERGMTIDLGFAWITLPSGLEVGIVDVPGHHRFVRNMLAGVGGVSLALFVVAATESWMPQSQEHLDIIDLLGIEKGIVVLTKADLVEPDWLEMVTAEVRTKLAGSTLAEAEIISVSAVTGAGLPYLVRRIDAILAAASPPADTGRPRLWIDRVFTIKGAGTVITGTLEGGSLTEGQLAQILPGGDSVRLRGLQTHKHAVESAEPGARVAINLAGLDTAAVQRGDALIGSGQRQAASVINVELRLLPELNYSLPETSALQLYIGSAELQAKVRLLDRSELLPGEAGLAQLVLDRPAAIDFHDRFIVRDATRQETSGGGRVLDAQALRVRGRDLRLPHTAPGAYRVLSDAAVPVRRLDLTALQARSAATPEQLPALILHERGWATHDELRYEVPLHPDYLRSTVARLEQQHELINLPSHVISLRTWHDLSAKFHTELQAFHERYPLRVGLARETLRSGWGMDARLFEEVVACLIVEGVLCEVGPQLRLPDFTPTFSPEQQAQVAALLAALAADQFSPPDLDELAAQGYQQELIAALVEQGRLVKVGKGLVYLDEALKQAKSEIAAVISAKGEIDVGGVRDLLGTTRKFAVPLLEYLDQAGFTRRIGDKRILASAR